MRLRFAEDRLDRAFAFLQPPPWAPGVDPQPRLYASMSRVDLAMCKPAYSGLSRDRFLAWATKTDADLIADMEQAAQAWREGGYK